MVNVLPGKITPACSYLHVDPEQFNHLMREKLKENGGSEQLRREQSRESYYLIKTPALVKRIYKSYLWSMPANEKIIYLTFDDGPHPTITPFVLGELKRYNALATFFCIGKNVVAYPAIYKQILDNGHTTGNHTFNHLNGWKTDNETYLKDVLEASHVIDSTLFRPCYGRITGFQAQHLAPVMRGKKPTIVMWDVLSGDFDTGCTPRSCLSNVVLAAGPGSIVVFHDSEKALPRLEYALPRVLDYFSKQGFSFAPLRQEQLR